MVPGTILAFLLPALAGIHHMCRKGKKNDVAGRIEREKLIKPEDDTSSSDDSSSSAVFSPKARRTSAAGFDAFAAGDAAGGVGAGAPPPRRGLKGPAGKSNVMDIVTMRRLLKRASERWNGARATQSSASPKRPSGWTAEPRRFTQSMDRTGSRRRNW